MRKSNGKPQNKQHEITRQRKRLRHLGCTEEQIERNVAPMMKMTEALKKRRSRAQCEAEAAVSVPGLRDAAAKRICELTKRIHELTKQWAENAIALGLEFKLVRDTFPVVGHDDDVGAPTSSSPDHTKRPGWHDWIKKNTAWSYQQVNSFIRVAEKFAGRKLPANVSHSLLEFLARDYVPEEAREEVLDRAGKGEKMVLAQAQEIVRKKRTELKDATKEPDADAGADGGEEAETENLASDRALHARRLVLASIEMDGSILETITKEQLALITSLLGEIAPIPSRASWLISYRRHAKSLAEIEAAAEANDEASFASGDRPTP